MATEATRDQIFITLLAGVHDPESYLSVLRGIPHVAKCIFELATNEFRWKRCIRLPDAVADANVLVACEKTESWCGWETNDELDELPESRDTFLFLTELQRESLDGDQLTEADQLLFPPPKDINVNMMPFVLSFEFEDSKLPEYLEPYWPLIKKCSHVEVSKRGSGWLDGETSDIDKVCYLTVQESPVESGRAQRREGAHVDCPGYVKLKSSVEEEATTSVSTSEGSGTSRRYDTHRWGLGGCHFVPAQTHLNGLDHNSYLRSFELTGGIYVASSVENSCRAWNCKIIPSEEGGKEERKERKMVEEGEEGEKERKVGESGKGQKAEEEEETKEMDERKYDEKQRTTNCSDSSAENGDSLKGDDETGDNLAKSINGTNSTKSRRVRSREVFDHLGNVEHLRHLLPAEMEQTLKANRMYWMTDRTPHESLPLKEGTYRQFFRLVTSQVSLWYEDHSTPNPNGVKPDPKITKIVKGNKFGSEGVYIVE